MLRLVGSAESGSPIYPWLASLAEEPELKNHYEGRYGQERGEVAASVLLDLSTRRTRSYHVLDSIPYEEWARL